MISSVTPIIARPLLTSPSSSCPRPGKIADQKAATKPRVPLRRWELDIERKVSSTFGRVEPTYTLSLKTHGYHWNVSGPVFRSLHLVIEEEYTELRDAVDEIAERILALGFPAPASYAQLGQHATVEDGTVPDAGPQTRGRQRGGHPHRTRSCSSRRRGQRVATAALVAVRIETHEKTAWMLRATSS
jgi:starvation-inducible DNA-binding protein